MPLGTYIKKARPRTTVDSVFPFTPLCNRVDRLCSCSCERMRSVARAAAALAQPLHGGPWRAFSAAEIEPRQAPSRSAEAEREKNMAEQNIPDRHTDEHGVWGEVAVVAEIPAEVRQRRVRCPANITFQMQTMHSLLDLSVGLPRFWLTATYFYPFSGVQALIYPPSRTASQQGNTLSGIGQRAAWKLSFEVKPKCARPTP